MKIPVPALRWQLVGALVGTVLLASAPAASAAASSSSEVAPRQAHSAREGGTSSGPLAFYRGIQGGNLCLLARCTVGASGPGGHTGPSNTQGFNLCLLALCTVRP
ncbi:hypothetical protein N7925_06665 [Streptomyces sp. CA-278952]|uniref:hypothetical protein n=1 Tax=unclassified Streptomyces TaxID=2593676 RepID=UPI002241F26B|nr:MULTISPECIES: hypothetical protein [unclassified Streptomyces]UZI33550.1 hypothetical protein OH133_06780 [Streptomyces sp. VB1]WDG28044.1 hypothetical protein N7925_06665 [Streptomyces sp. CA-278952]